MKLFVLLLALLRAEAPDDPPPQEVAMPAPAPLVETLEEMRNTIGSGIAGADIVVERPQEGPPTGLPVNIEISGEDAVLLKRLGDEVVAILSNSPL